MNKKTKIKHIFILVAVSLLILSTLLPVFLTGVLGIIQLIILAIQVLLFVLVFKKKHAGYQLLVVLGVIALYQPETYKTLFEGSTGTILLTVILLVVQVLMIVFSWQVGKALYPDKKMIV